MTRELVIVIGMFVLYLCSFLGLATAWISYRKYKKNTGLNPPKVQNSEE